LTKSSTVLDECAALDQDAAVAKDRTSLEASKRASALQTLMKVARLVDERATARVNEAAGRVVLRPAHTRLFPHIDLAGTRLTELARRVGITKQAVGQLVDDLVEQGVLDVVADPVDGRARLVRFTKRGLDGIAHGLKVLASIEAELAKHVGRERIEAMHATLLALQDVLDEP
jgi:DNA-binding MarR family transcriptional regulator